MNPTSFTFYPWDPQHGQSGRKRQIIETDLGVEKAWSAQGAYAQTDYIRRVAQRARDTKVAGLVGRARLIGDKPFQDTHEINLYAFSRLRFRVFRTSFRRGAGTPRQVRTTPKRISEKLASTVAVTRRPG